jgi:hypothetical protein
VADWVDITDASVDPDAPVTSELAYAWRDNPIALAQGAVGAQKVRSEALNLVAGSGNRTSIGTIFQLNNLDRVAAFYVSSAVQAGGVSSGSVAVSYQTSTNGGTTWSGDNVLLSYLTAGDASSRQSFDIVTIAAGVNSVRFRMSADDSPFAYATCAAVGIRGVNP